eukprot:13618788-Alexandrium_andersonii.AAC.1
MPSCACFDMLPAHKVLKVSNQSRAERAAKCKQQLLWLAGALVAISMGARLVRHTARPAHFNSEHTEN